MCSSDLSLHVVRAAATAMWEIGADTDGAHALEQEMIRVTQGRCPGGSGADCEAMANIARTLLQAIGLVRAAPASRGRSPAELASSPHAAPAIDVAPGAELTPERLTLLAGRLVAETIGLAARAAHAAVRFAYCAGDCEEMRGAWEGNRRLAARLAGAEPFVTREETLC